MSNQSYLALDIQLIFWQEWQQYRDYLYRCCVKWMGGNPINAEDALSRAMLKAWEKVQKYAVWEITNFKAWLIVLIRNLCVDIHRERSRSANRVENIEGYAYGEEQELTSPDETPETALEAGERTIIIRRAIDDLPPRLRETFILHYYKEFSYLEIAQQQEISYQNVCKRISQARKILQDELRAYFIENEKTDRDKSASLTAIDLVIEEIPQENAPVKATSQETIALVEDVESINSKKTSNILHEPSLVLVAAPCDKHLEVKSYDSQCSDVVLNGRLLILILTLLKFDTKIRHWRSFCLLVQEVQQIHPVAKVAEELVFTGSSRSPPFYYLFLIFKVLKR